MRLSEDSHSLGGGDDIRGKQEQIPIFINCTFDIAGECALGLNGRRSVSAV